MSEFPTSPERNSLNRPLYRVEIAPSFSNMQFIHHTATFPVERPAQTISRPDLHTAVLALSNEAQDVAQQSSVTHLTYLSRTNLVYVRNVLVNGDTITGDFYRFSEEDPTGVKPKQSLSKEIENITPAQGSSMVVGVVSPATEATVIKMIHRLSARVVEPSDETELLLRLFLHTHN